MSFFQAQAARAEAGRGAARATAGRPVTVADAVDGLRGRPGGARRLRSTTRLQRPANHLLAGACWPKVVMLLTETELRDWRNGIVAKGLKGSANRIAKSLKAALALAGKRDKRAAANTAAWRNGLKPLKAKDWQRSTARQLLSAGPHHPRHRARVLRPRIPILAR